MKKLLINGSVVHHSDIGFVPLNTFFSAKQLCSLLMGRNDLSIRTPGNRILAVLLHPRRVVDGRSNL